MPKVASAKVTINYYLDGEPAHNAILPRSATFAEVRQRWQEASEVEGAVAFCLEDSDGALLPLEGLVSDLMPSGKRAVSLLVFREEEKSLRLLGSEREPVAIRLQPQETIQDLTSRAKEILGIENRVARLLSGGRVLDAGALACSELAGSSVLDLDLECCLLALCLEPASQDSAVTDLEPAALESGIDVRVTCHFASEPARALSGEEGRVTAFRGRKTIEGDTALSALLSEEALLSSRPIGVFLERQVPVFVEDKVSACSKMQAMWPTMKLADLLSSEADCVVIDGEKADPRQAVWQAGLLKEGHLTITRVGALCVQVVGSMFSNISLFRV